MTELRCIGRTDSLGDPHDFGSYIGFVYLVPGSARHTIVVEEIAAEQLLGDLTKALWGGDEP